MRSLAKAFISLAIGVSVFGQTYNIQTIAGGAFPADGPAQSAILGLIGGMAVDTSGNLYVALHSSHMVVKVDASGNMTRIAGTGVYGFSGDGGPATSAQLAYPQGLVFDKSGNLYIQDGGNQRVRLVSGGTITTVPGTEGLLGVTQGVYLGEMAGVNALPGLASMAVLPGMAVNSKGVLYVSDTINHRVFSVSGGVATVIAGTGEPGFTGDGAIASSGQLNHPFGLAVDSSDDLLIADTHNNRIREILATNGYIYTICGTGTPAYSGDEADASSAALNNPIGLAIDSGNNIFIADSGNFVIRKIWYAVHQGVLNGVATSFRANVIETVAGSGTFGQSYDGTAATTALLGVPAAVAVDASGNIYFADNDHHRVMVMSNDVISTVAGGGTANGDNGPATSAQLVVPLGVAADSQGNVYSLDMGRNGVRKVSNGTISTVAGNGIFGSAGDYGSATAAQLSAFGIASDSAGNLFLASPGNYLAKPNGGRIRESTGGNMYTVAGTGQVGSGGDGGPATNAQLYDPMGVAMDASGNLYIADTYNYRVRKVSASDKVIRTVAGDGTYAYGGDNGPATNAQISRPFRVAVDPAGNVFIADFDNSVIREVSIATGNITTIAGTGTQGYSGDGGPSVSAQIDRPSALAVNAAGDLFFFDLGNSVVRKISNGIISTVAGNGVRGYSGDNGPALDAELGRSYGIATDASGKIYVSDVDNGVIRVLSTGPLPCSYTVSPLSSQVGASGGNVTLAITAGASCTWSVAGLPDWIAVSGNSTGTGPANVTLVIAANTSAARNVNLNVAGSAVAISQAAAPCSYTLSPTGQFFPASGGSGTFQVIAYTGCAWTVTSAQSWVTLTGATAGNGTGTVAYQVAANAGAERQGTITYLAAGAERNGDFSTPATAYTVDQGGAAIAGLVSAGSLAHFASAGGWKTTFTLVNLGATDATAQWNFLGDTGSAEVLPLSLPQTSQTGMAGSTIQQPIPAGAVLPVESAGLFSAAELTGGAQLLATGNVDGFSVFRYQPSAQGATQEAVVPLETRNASSYWLAFDNTNGYSTGLAVSNTTSQTVNVQVSIRNGSGAPVNTRTLSLEPNGHQAFPLAATYSETANLLGTLQFTTPTAGQISVLGIRVNPQGAFTSIPALVSASQTTGSIAHFASGGGWNTTYTLVNPGTSAATAKLSFFDDNGAALALPVSFPQTSSTTQTVSTVQQTLAAGATLIVETEGPASLDSVTGSAQLQTGGSVTGSAVFQYLGQQEAVVPLETRSGKSYVLAFDNTNGYFNGLAVANTTAQAASIAVTVRDAVTGKTTGSHVISLPANGHQKFLLNDPKLGFPETANTSGTLEFSTTTAGQISVLGLRFNPNAAFTSVPALLKQ
ncbi:MAG: BACON domain-containing carbohydrate-binding protein [Bryobacteraceae bacterium]|nr:BACON domain-containing carbohydrate-binding protein [Bryobacteraceae bacterium]